MAASPLRRWSVAELHQDLHDRIVQGGLRPGEALSETRMAEQYGLSRTPVRQVVHRLVEEGLLRVVPQVGTYVAPIRLEAVRDSQFVREALETRAVALAAQAATPAAVARLRACLDAQAEAIAAGKQARFFAADEAMHRMLLEMAGRRGVWDLIASAKAQLDRVRHLSLEHGDWPALIFAQHLDLVDRVAARDAEGAAQVMQTHLRSVLLTVERIAAEHAAFFENEGPTPVRAAG
jgi:DNA-binding GntR family transcriptional regulator